VKTHIARAGKIISELTLEELSEALNNGTLIGSDHWWRPGMKEWKAIQSESPLYGMKTDAGKSERDTEATWRNRPNHIPSQFGDEPATEKQLAIIRDAGLTDIVGLTKYDASRWIKLILDTDEARSSLNEKQLENIIEKQRLNELAGFGCAGFRTPSGQFRKEIKFCLKCIEEKREETRKNIEEEPESKRFYTSALKDDEKDFRDEIKQQMDARVDYWIWVIKCGRAKNSDKQWEMMTADDAWPYTYMYVEKGLADHLFSAAKMLPKVPTRKEVLSLLDKLDAASDDWDDTQPDLLLAELIAGSV
jgi:hypothetical protein